MAGILFPFVPCSERAPSIAMALRHSQSAIQQGMGQVQASPVAIDTGWSRKQVHSECGGSREEAQAFVDNEPFNNAAIFQQVSIFRMKKMRYNPHLVDAI